MSHEKLIKKLGEVIMFPLFGYKYSYFAPIFHFGTHIILFTLIWLYLPLIAIILPYMPYSP